jgi:hypothetical protein
MTRPWKVGLLSLLGAGSLGCAEGQRGFFGHEKKAAMSIKAPEADRCARQPANAKASCLDMARTATLWVKRLNADEEICLEGGIGDPPTQACTARAFIEDASTEGVLVEVRHADDSKHWKQYELRQVWFDTQALVDLELKEKGYE